MLRGSRCGHSQRGRRGAGVTLSVAPGCWRPEFGRRSALARRRGCRRAARRQPDTAVRASSRSSAARSSTGPARRSLRMRFWPHTSKRPARIRRIRRTGFLPARARSALRLRQRAGACARMASCHHAASAPSLPLGRVSTANPIVRNPRCRVWNAFRAAGSHPDFAPAAPGAIMGGQRYHIPRRLDLRQPPPCCALARKARSPKPGTETPYHGSACWYVFVRKDNFGLSLPAQPCSVEGPIARWR